MGSLNEFRHNATQCARLAKIAARESDRLVLLELAQSWLWLAELAQKSNAKQDEDLYQRTSSQKNTRAA